jgi:hypothetical protein
MAKTPNKNQVPKDNVETPDQEACRLAFVKWVGANGVKETINIGQDLASAFYWGWRSRDEQLQQALSLEWDKDRNRLVKGVRRNLSRKRR